MSIPLSFKLLNKCPRKNIFPGHSSGFAYWAYFLVYSVFQFVHKK
jgi:hypothetical protein